MDEANVSPAAVAKGLISFNPGFLTKPTGIVKLVEFILLLLAWALCSGFRNGYVNAYSQKGYPLSAVNYSSGAVGFFLFVTVTLWLVVLIFIILGLLGLLDKLKIPKKMLIFAIFHGASAVVLLISTAIIAADAAAIPSLWCDNVVSKYAIFTTTCATYEAAVAFGVFSILAFIVDAVLCFFSFRTDGGPGAV